MWIRAEGALFPAIVELELFEAAQTIVARRNRRRLSDAEMLDRLRELYAQRGALSAVIIDDPFGRAQRLSNGFELGGFVAALGRPGAVKTFGPQKYW